MWESVRMHLKLMAVVGVLVALLVNYCNSGAFLYGTSFIGSQPVQSFQPQCNGKIDNDGCMKVGNAQWPGLILSAANP